MSDISDIETLAVEQERATYLGVVIKSICYRAPATSKTAVVFDMVITSQKKYPQVQRATMTTK